jgi:condensin complex subunit 2
MAALISAISEAFLPDLTVLDDKAISHSLAGFSFSKDAFAFDETTFFRDDTRQYSDDDNDNDPGIIDGAGGEDFPMDIDGGGEPPVEDFFVGEQAVEDEFGCDDNLGQDAFGDGETRLMRAEEDQLQEGHRAAFVPFDSRRVPNERDLVMAMTDADGDGGMMDYFDQNFLKNWAGPEHWKLRKVVRRRKFIPFSSVSIVQLSHPISGRRDG